LYKYRKIRYRAMISYNRTSKATLFGIDNARTLYYNNVMGNRVKTKSKKNIPIKIAVFIVYVLLCWTFIIPLIATVFVYRYLFYKRSDKTEMLLSVKDYPELICDEFKVQSAGNELACFLYRDRNKYDGRALILLCHGLGCSHGNYLNRARYFTDRGYAVMMFDISGCGASGGKVMRGLPQSHVDIHAMLGYIESSEYKDMPLLVYGHSWSGFGTAAALNYGHTPLALVTASGFDDCASIMRFQAEKMAGKQAVMMMPYFSLVQRMLYGKASLYRGVDGINKYGGRVLITHSKDDPTVPYKCSIALRKDRITNPNAEILLYDDRGHTLSRSVRAEDNIKRDCAGRPRRKMYKNECYFKWEVDCHYHYCSRDDVFDIDESFMDAVESFYAKALEERR